MLIRVLTLYLRFKHVSSTQSETVLIEILRAPTESSMILLHCSGMVTKITGLPLKRKIPPHHALPPTPHPAPDKMDFNLGK